MSTLPDRAVVVVFAVILTLGVVPVGTAMSIAQSPRTAVDDGPSIAAADTPEADTTVTRIAIDEGGTATWSVTIRTRLANESDVDDYEAFQERFRADRTSYVEQFEERMTGVVSSAAASTDRSMTPTDFRAETSIQEVPRRWGTVTYSFRWTNFAAVDGDAIVVGDVFEGGLYLDDDDRLQIVPPKGYAPTATSPPPDESDGATVVWAGPENFADQHPTVRFEPANSAVSSDSRETTTWTEFPLVAAGVTLLFVSVASVVIAVSVASRRDPRQQMRSNIPVLTGTPTENAATDPDDDTGVPSDGDEPVESESIDSPASVPDLATDEDQVRALLEQNGGRIRQAAIAEELEWSASKTSRVVSGMAEANAVEKLRIGRENVIELREEGE
ncbi:helix-turn-helix transcriptional regulator [Halosolutus halophilus]|uniref:helix-turn-helix transcriptional regulator n=1 Tax=Halosolutus halophilus TaxID=1552990 RepID=UPI002234F80A|nr:DUF4897 domain-containing protein [Halosolutus halophilus]